MPNSIVRSAMINCAVDYKELDEERTLRAFAVFLACRRFVGVLSPDEILDLMFATDNIPLDILMCENNKSM